MSGTCFDDHRLSRRTSDAGGSVRSLSPGPPVSRGPLTLRTPSVAGCAPTRLHPSRSAICGPRSVYTVSGLEALPVIVN